MSAPYVVLTACAIGLTQFQPGDPFDPVVLKVPHRRVQQCLTLGHIGPASVDTKTAPAPKKAPKKTAPAPAPAPADPAAE